MESDVAVETRSHMDERTPPTLRERLPMSGPGAWVIRASLTLLAFGSLWLSQIEDDRFSRAAVGAFRFDLRLWSATITPLILAGMFFTVAACYGSPRPRRGRGRLILGVVALIPALHLGFIMWAPQFSVHWPAWLVTPRWFDLGEVPHASAVIGCGVCTAGSRR